MGKWSTVSFQAACGSSAIILFFIMMRLLVFAGDIGKTRYFTLDNGLQVLLQERDHFPLVNIVLAVNSGSKDETPAASGMVHILEHLILLGSTASHTGDEIVKEARARGIYLNAHTDHDLMTLEVSLPAEQVEFALDFVKDKVFSFKLVETELAREKKIILEEINHILDDPVRSGTALALQNLFLGHAYETPIFGSKEIIQKCSGQQLEKFYKTYFVPGNCSLSMVGSFDSEGLERKVRKLFGELERNAVPEEKFPTPPVLKKSLEVSREMDINQAYSIIGFLGPHFNHRDYFAVNLLTYILGQGINPLLNQVLRGRKRLAEMISVRYISLKHGGAVLIYLTTEPGKMKIAQRQTLRFLRTTSSFRYSRNDFLQKDQSSVFDYLESAKNQVKFTAQESRERGLYTAVANARYMLLKDRSKEMTDEVDIEKIDSTHIRNAASKYLSGEKYVIVSLIPRKNSKKKTNNK